MAIGETTLANEFATLGSEQENTAQTDVQDVASNFEGHVDYSATDSPFDSFSGYNIEKIQQDQEQSFGNNSATQNEVGSPTTTQTTIKPGQTLSDADATALYNKNIALAKNYAANIGQKFVAARNPALAYGNYEFDQYTTNVDRYRGYGKETFNKLGFNPLEENESYYNANTTGWQDFGRMTGQFGTLFASSFMSNYHAVYNYFSGHVGLMDADTEAAREFNKAMSLGSSGRGGWEGSSTNFVLNMAYATGIAANVFLEETAIWALGVAASPFTEGASLGVAAVESGAVAIEAVSKLRQLRLMYSAAFRGKEIGQMTTGGIQMLKALGKVEDAKAFWTASRIGAKNLAEGAIGFINPFRQGTEVLRGIKANEGAYRNLSNFAKVTTTFGGFYRGMRENMFAVGESQLEGGGTFNDIVEKEIDIWQKKNNKPGERPPDEELKRIYKDAEAGGRLDTLINIPMIFLSNRVLFDGLFNFKGIKALTDLSTSAFGKNAGKNIAFNIAGKTYENVGKTGFGKFKTAMKVFINPKVYAGAFLNYTKHNFMEGVQESLQDVTSGSIKNYYTSLYNNPSQGGSNLIKSSIYTSLREDVASMKGLETFMSGFLMGGGMAAVKSPAISLVKGSKEFFMSKITPEKYKAYVAQKDLAMSQATEALINASKDAETLFSRRGESMTNQIAANNNMSQAKLNNDDHAFYDAKDDKTFDHIFTMLDNGTFDKLIDGFKELSTLSEEDIADYFNLESGTKAKEKVAEYIERATQIKERYDTIQEKAPNPFNPGRFKKNTSLRVREFIAYKAFEDAKKTAIASEYGFERAVERMVSTFDDISKNSPLLNSSPSDFTVLQTENSLKSELKLLKQEIKTLELGGVDEKRLAKQKTAKYDVMIQYLEELKVYNKEKESPVTDQNGRVSVPYNNHLLDPLRDTFHKYVKVIAKLNNQVNVFDDKINSVFDKISDYYTLSNDAQKYAEVVNHLSNPANLLRYADAAQETLLDIFNNKEQIIANSISSYIGVHELNALMRVIGQKGAYINPADVDDLYKTGKMPSSFFDLRKNTVIDRTDARYSSLINLIESFSRLVRNAHEEVEIPENLQAEKTEEEKQKEAEELARQKAEEEAAKIAEAAKAGVTLPVTMDTELESRLKKAYEMFLITGNPNVTFEDYVKTYANAQRIKEEYEREKSNNGVPPVVPVVVPPAGAPVKTESEINYEKAQDIINKVTSLKDLPTIKQSDNKESTLQLIELIASGNLKSIDVLDMIEKKRVELAKILTVDDLEKGDFITFTDGREGWVTSVTNAGSIQMKMLGSTKGEYEIMNISDIAKTISMIEENKKISPDPVEPVEITPENKEAVEASHDTMNEFVNNTAELQKINEENINNVGKDNTANEDDLLNNIGCNPK